MSSPSKRYSFWRLAALTHTQTGLAASVIGDWLTANPGALPSQRKALADAKAILDAAPGVGNDSVVCVMTRSQARQLHRAADGIKDCKECLPNWESSTMRDAFMRAIEKLRDAVYSKPGTIPEEGGANGFRQPAQAAG